MASPLLVKNARSYDILSVALTLENDCVDAILVTLLNALLAPEGSVPRFDGFVLSLVVVMDAPVLTSEFKPLRSILSPQGGRMRNGLSGVTYLGSTCPGLYRVLATEAGTTIICTAASRVTVEPEMVAVPRMVIANPPADTPPPTVIVTLVEPKLVVEEGVMVGVAEAVIPLAKIG